MLRASSWRSRFCSPVETRAYPMRVDLCLGMDWIVSKLVGRGKIWDFDNEMSFDTGKGGRNGNKRGELWMSHKRSDTVGEPPKGSN